MKVLFKRKGGKNVEVEFHRQAEEEVRNAMVIIKRDGRNNFPERVFVFSEIVNHITIFEEVDAVSLSLTELD